MNPGTLHSPPLTAKPARRWPAFLRFSLRTLLLTTLLLGSAAALWLHWHPWRLQTVIATGSPPDFAAFSADELRVIWRYGGTVHVADARSGVELSTLPAPLASFTYETQVDGRPIAIAAGYQEPYSAEPLERDILNEKQHLVSLEFIDTDLGEALSFMRSISKLPIFNSKEVSASRSIAPHLYMALRHLGFARAMNLIVHGAGFDWAYNSGVLSIIPPDPAHPPDLNQPIRAWDLETGKQLCAFDGSQEHFARLFLSPNGRYILTSHLGGVAKIWDVSSGKKTAEFQMDLVLLKPENRSTSMLTEAAISDDGAHVLGHVEGSEGVEAVDLTTGKAVGTLLAGTHPTDKIGWSIDQKFACFQSRLDEIELLNLTTDWKPKEYLPNFNLNPSTNESRPPLFSPHGERAIVHLLGSTQLLDSETGAEIQRFDRCRNSQFSTAKPYFALADFGRTELHNTSDGSLLVRLPQTPRTLATAWADVRTLFKAAPPLPPALGYSTPALQFSADGNRLLAAYGGNALGIWAYQRPATTWGFLWIPEFWLTIAIAGVWIWNFRRTRSNVSIA